MHPLSLGATASTRVELWLGCLKRPKRRHPTKHQQERASTSSLRPPPHACSGKRGVGWQAHPGGLDGTWGPAHIRAARSGAQASRRLSAPWIYTLPCRCRRGVAKRHSPSCDGRLRAERRRGRHRSGMRCRGLHRARKPHRSSESGLMYKRCMPPMTVVRRHKPPRGRTKKQPSRLL